MSTREAIESTLALYTWDGSRWLREQASSVDPSRHTVSATPNRLGLWAVLGETHRVILPVVWSPVAGARSRGDAEEG